MVIRIAGLAVLSATLILILMTGSAPPLQTQLVAPESPDPVQTQPIAPQSPPPAAQLPAPMFSPWYGESLGDILQLEQADVARLEQQLAEHPDDFRTRLKLMAYHQRADRAGRREDLAKRVRHVLWVVEHHPDSEILHSYVSDFSRDQLTSAEYERTVTLWHAAATAHVGEAAVNWNAASFFRGLSLAFQHVRFY
ncbi:MAG TPA: hypothetical protein VN428_22680 [Bryobacteraceae bacterium]|nr:hypothetical protein [Bryobacteraceae bacterium]